MNKFKGVDPNVIRQFEGEENQAHLDPNGRYTLAGGFLPTEDELASGMIDIAGTQTPISDLESSDDTTVNSAILAQANKNLQGLQDQGVNVQGMADNEQLSLASQLHNREIVGPKQLDALKMSGKYPQLDNVIKSQVRNENDAVTGAGKPLPGLFNRRLAEQIGIDVPLSPTDSVLPENIKNLDIPNMKAPVMPQGADLLKYGRILDEYRNSKSLTDKYKDAAQKYNSNTGEGVSELPSLDKFRTLTQLRNNLPSEKEKSVKDLISPKDEPSRQIASEKSGEQSPDDELKSILSELRKPSDVKTAEWADAISSIASTFGKVAPNKVDITPLNFAKDVRGTAQDNLSKRIDLLTKLKASKGSAGKVYSTADGLVRINEDGTPELIKTNQLGRERFEEYKRSGKSREADRQELSDKQVEAIGNFKEIDNRMNQIEAMLPKVEGKLGIIGSNVERAKEVIPGLNADQDFVKIQQLTGMALADYLKSMSGATVSDKERASLLLNIPNVSDKPETFKTKLATFKSLINGIKENQLKTIEQSGKNPGALKENRQILTLSNGKKIEDTPKNRAWAKKNQLLVE